MLMQILIYVFLALFGLVPCVFIVLSIPVVIIWKIYRKIRYGIRIVD